MKKIIFLLLIFRVGQIQCQNDVRFDEQFCVVYQADSIIYSNYLTHERVESSSNIYAYDNLSEIDTSNIPELPNTGELIEGDIYLWQGIIIMVRQSHYRTIYNPDQTPALFSFYRTNSDTLQWIEGEKIEVGWIRIYIDVSYVCIQAHMTVYGQTPDVVPALWNVIQNGFEWQVGVAYSINDEVTYNGNTYKCLQSHTSIITWIPPNVPALWQLIE